MRVLITGAARAIGAATAQVLTERGFEVVATARRPELLADVSAALRLPLDVTDDESVRACMAEAGPIDVLVNNAAISEPGPLERYPLDRFRAVLETNVVGALRMVQAVVPGIGRVASPLGGAYAASKFALEAMGETLHFELGHFGIRVVLVEPGFVAPGMKGGPEWGMEPPYDELGRQLSGTDASLLGDQGRPGPEVVGEAIHRAITTDEPVLRWPVGADAELVLATRTALDDAAFEAAMRETLGLTW